MTIRCSLSAVSKTKYIEEELNTQLPKDMDGEVSYIRRKPTRDSSKTVGSSPYIDLTLASSVRGSE
jgi:hypothetical protein